MFRSQKMYAKQENAKHEVHLQSKQKVRSLKINNHDLSSWMLSHLPPRNNESLCLTSNLIVCLCLSNLILVLKEVDEVFTYIERKVFSKCMCYVFLYLPGRSINWHGECCYPSGINFEIIRACRFHFSLLRLYESKTFFVGYWMSLMLTRLVAVICLKFK